MFVKVIYLEYQKVFFCSCTKDFIACDYKEIVELEDLEYHKTKEIFCIKKECAVDLVAE